jgi:DNA-binding NarL/FixJ family response regulator
MLNRDNTLIRILLIDDHSVVRAGLRMVIESKPGLKVVEEAATGRDALAAAAREMLDIILLDLDLGDESGLDILPALRTTAQNARVIALTGVRNHEMHRSAMRLGAMGLVLKSHAKENLIKAIERVHAGEAWLDRSMMASLLTEMSGPHLRQKQEDPEVAKIAMLTEREREVVALVCEGLNNKAIGERMSISDTTVRHHLSSIFNKLDVANRLELVIYAYRQGIVKLQTSE